RIWPSAWGTAHSGWTLIPVALRPSAFMLGDRVAMSACLNIAKAARSTAHSSAAGEEASGAGDAGMAVGKSTTETEKAKRPERKLDSDGHGFFSVPYFFSENTALIQSA